MKRRLQILLVALVAAILLVVVGVAVGITFERVVGVDAILDDTPPPDPSVSRIVGEVASLLRREALEPSSVESMTAGALRGLLDSLDDPYAVYLDELHYGYFNEQNDGEFFGVGINVTVRDGAAIIVSPIEGTPAFEAGLLAEDEIVSVDGYEPEEWSLEDVVARVRGPEGTQVVLGIRRNGSEDVFDVPVTRARIDIPNTSTELIDGDIGYIRLLTFNNKSARDVRDDIGDLTDQGARVFILDLRDNPGGLLDSAVDVASLFVEDGVIVTVEARDMPPETHRASGSVATDAPLVVLVNENSASASEIVAGALQDYERAQLVGVQTFGKGSVQTVDSLSNGGAIKFTIAEYLTPRGRSINKVGLAPDVEVDMSPKHQSDPETDLQRQRAVELAREAID